MSATNENFMFASPWTSEDCAVLRGLHASETPMPEIARYLGRSQDDVRSKAYELGLSVISFRHSVAA